MEVRPTIKSEKGTVLQIKTILNRVQKFKSFVYGTVHWLEGATVPTLEVEIQSRANSRPICSHRGKKRAGYDRLPVRRFEFIPMWGCKANNKTPIKIFFMDEFISFVRTKETEPKKIRV